MGQQLILSVLIALLFTSCKKTVSEDYKDSKDRPVITLVGSSNEFIDINTSFTDSGAKAVDKEEGDISEKIIVSGDKVDITKVGSYNIKYNVTDLVGNKALEIVRVVHVKVFGTLTIKLNGDNPVYLPFSDTYQEPGVKVLDSFNNEMDSSNVEIVGEVSSSTSGYYIINYQVMRTINSKKIYALASRTVIIGACLTGVGNIFKHNDAVCACSSGNAGTIFNCVNGAWDMDGRYDVGVLCIDIYDPAIKSQHCPRYDHEKEGCYTSAGIVPVNPDRPSMDYCIDQH